ncbi:YL1 nuclear protein-domain-containing protein [Lasiosphaeris hirsuta]|uniref:YL1 nuclear protein-domain-containing protein n=1 Tax=Lasiosphaeris hirsuta TaxID=260670 RepID=A0AA40DTU6_9PEZI|nr:YL1 nuclear protein-domain-containing protein [Lasiosphaeris hirsuta]
MATNKDESKISSLSDIDVTASSDDDSDAGGGEQVERVEKIEWLATTRTKRSTAGNRMKSMLAIEAPADDDDLELLFAEDEDDAGFTDDAKDNASDVLMDSSSDDEDQGRDADDMEGEKELERQAREKKNAQRKRKAQEAIPAKFRKKVRIEQPAGAADSASPRSSAPPPPQHPAPSRPAPRPKKKSERMSWLPSTAELPTRASDRSTTRISKQQLHEKMVQDEVRRKKQLERMEKNAKRLEALKKPPMTQAERLAEAALIEKRNSKSLNRWEVAEKQREEERLRKIAALHNRKLDGPVVTFWSGIQQLEEGQLKHVGNLVSIEEKAPRKKRQSAAVAAALTAAPATLMAATPTAQELEGGRVEDTSKPPSPTEKADPKPGNMVPEIKPEVSEPAGLPPPFPSAGTQNPQPATLQDSSPNHPVEEARFTPTLTAPPALAMAPLLTTDTPLATAPVAAVTSPMVPALPLVSTPATEATPAPVPAPAPVSAPAPISTPALSVASMAPPPLPLSPDVKQHSSAVLAAPILAPPVGLAPPMLGGRMSMLGFSASNGTSNCLAPPNTSHTPSPLSLPPSTPGMRAPKAPKPTVIVPTASATPSPSILTPPPPPPPLPPSTPLQPTQGNASRLSKGPETPRDAQSEPPREGKVTRSCIILQNFDENAIKDRQVQTQILFGRKMNKLAKPAHAPLCVITNHPAKYRDTKTGLPYYNSYAYKEIQRVYRGDYKWSRLLGAYVGSGNYAARGVPDRFLDPTKKRSTPRMAPDQEQKGSVLVPKEDADAPTPPKQAEARLEPVEDIKMEESGPGVAIPAPVTQGPVFAPIT